MPRKRIEITETMVRNAVGTTGYLSVSMARAIAADLTKQLNPPAWRVHHDPKDRFDIPAILYRDTSIRLNVQSGTATPDIDRRLRIAELVAGVLNARGVEVED